MTYTNRKNDDKIYFEKESNAPIDWESNVVMRITKDGAISKIIVPDDTDFQEEVE